jgi:cysteine desulfurase
VIYLDNNSTTPIDPRVRETMLPFLEAEFGNPSSPYQMGKRAAHALEKAREQVAGLIGAGSSREVVFTSGATESNYAAFYSATDLFPDRKHLITSRIEHSSILHIVDRYEQQGYEITRLPVDDQGRIDPAQFEAALRPEQTALASVMWANNETGTIQPIANLAAMARERGIPFHTDAVQAAGKIPLAFAEIPLSMASLSGHKFHAPKGIGALYIKRGLRYRALLEGSQEETRRGGTQNMASIAGMGRAAEIARQELPEASRALRQARDRFEETLRRHEPRARVLCEEAERLPNTSNILFPGIQAEGLLLLLDQQNICVSTGSACTTGSMGPSHVLKALGLTDEQARACLRFSFSRFNTEKEIDEALAVLPEKLQQLRLFMSA